MRGLTAEQIEKMETESANLQREFKAIEQGDRAVTSTWFLQLATSAAFSRTLEWCATSYSSTLKSSRNFRDD